jgi:rhamnogalacturonan endolyase
MYLFKIFSIYLIILLRNLLIKAENVDLQVSGLNADISNGLFSVKFQSGVGHSLVIDGKELIGQAMGLYCDINGGKRFSAESLHITHNSSEMVDIYYLGEWGELHYVVNSNVSGIYSYFVATGIGEIGEFRTLYRVDGNIFRNGHNAERSGAFPSLAEIKNGTKLQDETWTLPDGENYTKYNWASYVAEDRVHGVYGENHGVWLISSSHEYINGGPMKQELMVHIESSTGSLVNSINFLLRI